MHQRESETSEIRADIRADFAELTHRMEAGFAQVDARFASLGAGIDSRFAAVDSRFSSLEKTIGLKVAEATATHLKWSVAMWIATMAFLGAMIRMR